MTFKEVRAYCKQPLMTYFYNSRQEPINAFGKDTQELQAFYDTITDLFPGAANVMQAINERWDNTALYHEFSTPDGHIARIQVTKHIDGILDNEGLNLPYRFESNTPSDVYTPLVANFVHAHDGFLIRNIIDKAPFQVAHIHDDIQCHPNNMRVVRELFLDGLAQISNSRSLEQFCNKNFNIDNKQFIKGLTTSSYAIC